jgi:hypothetical protein
MGCNPPAVQPSAVSLSSSIPRFSGVLTDASYRGTALPVTCHGGGGSGAIGSQGF